MSFELDAAGLGYPNGQRALSRITLSARRGERIALIGPSGAGKTSMLRLLATSLRPSEGRVDVLGVSPWDVSAARLRRRTGFRMEAGTVTPVLAAEWEAGPENPAER